jgi:hypothetical protein
VFLKGKKESKKRSFTNAVRNIDSKKVLCLFDLLPFTVVLQVGKKKGFLHGVSHVIYYL